MKSTTSFPIEDFTEYRTKMLNWAQPFNIFCFLDNQQYHFETPAFECLLAAGSKSMLELSAGNAFDELNTFFQKENDWLFGHLGYDLKNESEKLVSMNPDRIGFADCCFFVPETVLQLTGSALIIHTEDDAAAIFAAIQEQPAGLLSTPCLKTPVIKNSVTTDDYVSIVRKIQQHILRGDCYEVNFCQEFFAEQTVIDPFCVYDALMKVSPNPFAALYKINERFCICASPERYFKKSGSRVYSQPIKGTAKRDLANPQLDEESKERLLQSEKEKSENVMVVDLVRNDLSRVCKEGSVKVDELFGIYTFPHVHQMISTISGELAEGANWIDIVKCSFPMGSMTGAPKKRVMEIIERYEHTKRGLFSGAIGYVDPNGDADFNVVIRSILYNEAKKCLSFQAGSAITYYSNADEEYEECLTKAAMMRQVLEA